MSNCFGAMLAESFAGSGIAVFGKMAKPCYWLEFEMLVSLFSIGTGLRLENIHLESMSRLF